MKSLIHKGNLSGFDIDIINAIAEETGYEIEIKDVDFDTLIPSIQTGKADVQQSQVLRLVQSVEKRLISLRFISPEKLHKTICYILKRTVLLLKMI